MSNAEGSKPKRKRATASPKRKRATAAKPRKRQPAAGTKGRADKAATLPGAIARGRVEPDAPQTVDVRALPAQPDGEHPDLTQAARVIHSAIGMLQAEMRGRGLPHGGFFGQDGTTDRERAMASALWMAWKATQAIDAWLSHGDNWPLEYDEFIRAANVLRGGRPGGSHGHDLRMVIAAVTSPLMVSPRPSPESAAQQARERMAHSHGRAWEHVDAGSVADAYRAVFRDRERIATKVAGEPFWAARQRSELRLARDVVWLGYEVALARGTAEDRTWFRFPMPTKPTKQNLLRLFQDHARAERQRAEERNRKQKARGTD